MIEFAENAKKTIMTKGIKELFITIKYVQGPCLDNLCRMIPKIVVYENKPDHSNYILIFEDFVKVYAITPLAKTIEKHNDHVLISVSKLKKSLKVSGITYSF